MDRRFPAYPRGWFAVACSDELAPSETKIVHYFGEDIVLFRTASGVASAVAPHCPHLGAHLGHGGRVDGETLRCPFHGWTFNGTGQCVHIPGDHKIPPNASVRTWSLLEQNGVLFVYYSPSPGAAPPELPPLENEGWTENQSMRWTVRTHPQEVCENSVDIAHLGPVHGAVGASVSSVSDHRGPVFNVVIDFSSQGDKLGMAGQSVSSELNTLLHGLGHMIISVHERISGLRARTRVYCTPKDEGSSDILGIINMKRLPDEEATKTIAGMVFSSFTQDFVKDFPIWENKIFVGSPQLSAGDGPVGVYRRWAQQFYPEAPAPEGRRLTLRD